MTPDTTTLTVDGTQAFPESGKPKGSRLESSANLRSIYETFRLEDSLSAQQRMGIDAMIDGQPPFKESLLRKAAAAGRSNLNFGEAQSRINASLTSYHDLLENVPVLMDPFLPMNVLDDAGRPYAQDVIGHEFTTMMRDDENFDPRWQTLSKQFVTHGVSLAFMPDDTDWKPDVCGWDNFLIPRGTRIGEKNVDMLIITKPELPSDLYRKIIDEKAAEEMGWNVEAVKRALVLATRTGDRMPPNAWGTAWAELERMLKANDVWCNHRNASRVYTIHAFVKEYDGTFSHYITTQEGQDPKQAEAEFLYKKTAIPAASTNFFTIFCLNSGKDTYHTIRGQGYSMFPFVQTSNKLRNAVLDNVMLSSRTIIQPEDVNALDSSPMKISGQFVVLSPDYKIVERDFVDHSRMTLPVVHDFAQMMEGVSPSDQFQGNSLQQQEKTKYAQQAKQAAGSALTIGDVNMFYRGWRRLLREMFRRVQSIIEAEDYGDYPEVFAFVERCALQGVTPDIILAVERVYERRAIGAGSQGARQAILDRGMQRIGTLDEVGRSYFLHDAWVADVGVRDAQRYFPAAVKPRPVMDQWDAQAENALMMAGGNMDPLNGQNHTVHAMVHLGGQQDSTVPNIAASIQKLENWRNQGEQGDITDLQPEIAFLSMIVPHTEQHIEAMMADSTRAELAANFRKALQEYGAIWMTYVRQLEKALDEQRQDAAAQAQPDPVQIAKIEKLQAEIEMSVRKFQSTEMLKAADVQNRIANRNRETDAKMATMLAKHNAELATALPPASQSDVVTNQRVKTPNV